MPRRDNTTYQIEVMGVVGYAVFQAQRVESVISHCWLLNAPAQRDDKGEVYFEIWDINRDHATNARKTLGGLLKGINAERWFRKPLRDRLSRFIDDRNELIHRCFQGRRRLKLGRRADLVKLHRLASRIIREGYYFVELFDAFLGVQSDIGLQHRILRTSDPTRLQRLLAQKEKSGVMRELFRLVKKRTNI